MNGNPPLQDGHARRQHAPTMTQSVRLARGMYGRLRAHAWARSSYLRLTVAIARPKARPQRGEREIASVRGSKACPDPEQELSSIAHHQKTTHHPAREGSSRKCRRSQPSQYPLVVWPVRPGRHVSR